MKLRYAVPVVCACALTLGACTQIYKENDGVTFQAGNSVAHNTALQLVDPWPAGVQDTDLIVPAVRNGSTGGAGAVPGVIGAPAGGNAPADD